MRLDITNTRAMSLRPNSGSTSMRTVVAQGARGEQGLPGNASAAWTATTAVTTGTVRQAPDGSWIKSTASRTTRASFDSTEQGWWTATLATAGTLEADALSTTAGDMIDGQVSPAAMAQRFRAEWLARSRDTIPGAYVGATGASASTTVISGATDVFAYDRTNSRVNTSLRVVGCAPVQVGTAFPKYDAIMASGLTTDTGSLMMEVQSVISGVSELEVLWLGTGLSSPIQVWCDGIHLGDIAGTATADGTRRRTYVKLPDTRPHALRIICARGSFRGLAYVTASGSLAYPTTPKGPRHILLGDSYTEGSGATDKFHGYAHLVSQLLNLPDTWTSGSGGTGYLKVNGARPNLRDRLYADCIAQNPAIVGFAMGLNDDADAATLVAAAAAEWDSVAALPNVLVYVIGPWWPRTPVSPAADRILAYNEGLKAAAAARGIYYIDTIGETWFNDVNKTFYLNLSNDTTHPIDAGHFYLACLVAAHLFRLLSGAAPVPISLLTPFAAVTLASGTNPVLAPANTVVPAITGTAQVGLALTASTGTWDNTPTGYTYQWKADGANISGATSATYVPLAGDQGKVVTVTVTASNTSGAVAATSSATSAVAAASGPVPNTPDAPTAPNGAGVTVSAIHWYWAAPAGGATSYIFQLRQTGVSAWTDAYTGTGTDYNQTGLPAFTQYQGRVIAVNANGQSAPSPIYSRRTLSA